MSYQAKKKLVDEENEVPRSSVGRVNTSKARSVHLGVELYFVYFHDADIWQQMDQDLRNKIRRHRPSQREAKSL